MICVKNKECLLGEIIEGEMQLNELGKIAQKFWQEIPNHFADVELGEFVVMPNHVHGIVVINSNHRRRDAINRVSSNKTGGITTNKNPMLSDISLGKIIRWFKGRTTFEINKTKPYIGFHWQPKYHDHIIRDEKSLENIHNYIRYNPQNWDEDEYKIC